MAEPSSFKATVAEWRTVIESMKHFREHLRHQVKQIKDEDEQNLMYDEIERLESLIPDFERQFAAEYKR